VASYYQGARSVSEQFFELDLAAVLAVPGHDGGLFAVPEEDHLCRFGVHLTDSG
jgi:hypothetical protein